MTAFLIKNFKQVSELPFKQRLVVVLFSIFVVTQTTAVLSSALELVLSDRPPRARQLSESTQKKRAISKPKLHPLEILPADVVGATTKMRQSMPGSREYAAEAIYVPLSEDEAIRNPFSIYISVSFDPAGDLGKTLKKRLDRKGIKPEKIDIGRHTALAGQVPGKARYFVGWTTGRYIFEIDGAFSRRVQGELKPMTEFALEIARTIDKSAAEKLQSGGGL